MEDGDRGFVASRWIRNRLGAKSHRRQFTRLLRSLGIVLTKDVARRYTLLVDLLLDEGDTYMLVDKDDADNLLGFVTIARGILAFVYTDKSVRGHGYGRQLLKLAAADCASKESLHPVIGWKWKKEQLGAWLNVPKEKAA